MRARETVVLHAMWRTRGSLVDGAGKGDIVGLPHPVTVGIIFGQYAPYQSNTLLADLVLSLIAIIVVFSIWAGRYVKVGPNKLLILYGRRYKVRGPSGNISIKGYRLIRNGGAFVWPFIEKCEIMSLENIAIDVQATGAYTKNGVPISVDTYFLVKIKDDYESIEKAAEQFASKSEVDIHGLARKTLEGGLRSAIATLTVEELVSDLESLVKKINEYAGRELGNLGLEISSFTVRGIRDAVR